MLVMTTKAKAHEFKLNLKKCNYEFPGMVFVTTLFITFGFFGYLRWGEDVGGSLTLNLPQHEMYFD